MSGPDVKELPVIVIGDCLVRPCTALDQVWSPRRNVVLFAGPVANLDVSTVPLIMLLASSVVVASELQELANLPLVLMSPIAITLRMFIIAVPVPEVETFTAAILRPFVLSSAAPRVWCSVNVLGVTEPINRYSPLLIPDGVVSVPSTVY